MKIPTPGAFRLALLFAILYASPAAAQAPSASAEDGMRTTLSRWYEQLLKRDEGRLWDLVVPGFIDASPPISYAETKSRALGPRVYDSLPASALRFDWSVESVRRDSSFAKVEVWERGYFYAYAAQKTYERAAATTFILERRESDGHWLIAAHHSGAYGIPPGKVTDPMPDLRAYFYATEGKDRDPAADARAAARAR